MYREFFITTPLLEVPGPLCYGECTIVLQGQNGLSILEGEDRIAVDDAFDFVGIIADWRNLPALSVHLRRPQDSAPSTDPLQFTSRLSWYDWAFSQVPLKNIPVVMIDNSEAKELQQILTSTNKS